MSNAEWILTKNGILEKVKRLLGQIQEQYRDRLMVMAGLPSEVRHSSPKISRGENYKGLPYLVLDYPRCFNRDAVFAVRSFFWWGNFFSVTLQLSGSYKTNAEKRILDGYPLLAAQGFFICLSDDPWQHHFEKEYYQPVSHTGHDEFHQLVLNSPFIKIAAKISLESWDEWDTILPEYFEQLMAIAGGQLPSR